jgi:malate synthase
VVDDGRTITADLVREVLEHEVTRIRADVGDSATLAQAHALFAEVALADEFVDFLTLPAYDMID